MDVSPAKRSYFTCANVWWKLLFHSTIVKIIKILNYHLYLCSFLYALTFARISSFISSVSSPGFHVSPT